MSEVLANDWARLKAENERLRSLLDEATIILEVLVQNDPREEILIGGWVRKFRTFLTPPDSKGAT